MQCQTETLGDLSRESSSGQGAAQFKAHTKDSIQATHLLCSRLSARGTRVSCRCRSEKAQHRWKAGWPGVCAVKYYACIPHLSWSWSRHWISLIWKWWTLHSGAAKTLSSSPPTSL